MHIWLVTVGEPLPVDPGHPRLLRTGIFAAILRELGHEVTWWSSTFDHAAKQNRADRTVEQALPDGTRLVLLYGPGYSRNVSLARIRDHRAVSREFERRVRCEPAPDIILCSFPTIELSEAATRYGIAHGVPVVLDIRDYWPDIFLEVAPAIARPFARLALATLFSATRRACRQATAINGITPKFVEWGLRYAGRPPGPFDRDFPHGYKAEPPSAQAVAEADRMWEGHGISKAVFVACFFGAIGRQFELDTVIRAARRLHDAGTPVRFVLCGDGDRLAHYREAAGDLPNVLLPGWVDHAAIWSLMRRASAGLAPYICERSFTESIPNKAIEYLSAGLPVVSSLPGVLQALLSGYNCGLTYGNGDDAALAGALVSLRDSAELRAQLSKNAYSVFQSRFVAENVYRSFAEHLQTIVHANRLPERYRDCGR
jgi:glycosyltransferase involved in cell wall biosynthesis